MEATQRPPRIIAFTKDWGDVPTCTTHVLREMARTLPVLWIESIGTRKPALGAAGDLGRVWRRVRAGFRRARVVENGLRVLTPLLIPRAESRVGQWVNRRVTARLVRRELREMGPGPVEYWCFVPNAVDLLPERGTRNAGRGTHRCQVSGVRCQGAEVRAGGSRDTASVSSFQFPVFRPLVVYYCVDDWSKFRNLDGPWLAEKEEQMLRRADVVFTPARHLERRCRAAIGDRVHYAPHGVSYELFSQALRPDMVVPPDLAALPEPRIGFYGNVYPWIDFDLVERLARARPPWHFVLIGGIFCDVGRLQALPNVHFLGRREHGALPAYCKGFSAAMIPYDLRDPRMESVNPVKTRELLAAGVPVVAADVPELRGMEPDVLLARDVGQWLAGLERQMARADRPAISARMAGADWSAKVAWLRSVVDRAGLRQAPAWVADTATGA